MNIDEKRVEEPELIAESLNTFFGNIGRRLAQNIYEINISFKYFLHKSSKVAFSIAMIPPTANEVFNELNCSKNKKAADVFPNILKIAKVIPIFKFGEKSLIENCRPISLLPVFSKVIEKLIKTRILSCINRHDILYDRQNGFPKKRSTIYPLIDVITECYDNINSGNLSW